MNMQDLEKRRAELKPRDKPVMANNNDEWGALYRVVASRVRTLRVQKNFTQADVAEALGVSRTSMTNLEKGRQRMPLDKLYILAYMLDVSVYDLLPERIEEL